MTCWVSLARRPGNDFQDLFLVMCGGCAAAGQLLLQIGFIFALVVRHQLLKPISQGQNWRSWQRTCFKTEHGGRRRSTTIPIPLIFWKNVKPIHALAAFASFSTFTIATLSRRLPTCPAVASFLAPAFAWTFSLPSGTPEIRVSFYRAVFPLLHPSFCIQRSCVQIDRSGGISKESLPCATHSALRYHRTVQQRCCVQSGTHRSNMFTIYLRLLECIQFHWKWST